MYAKLSACMSISHYSHCIQCEDEIILLMQGCNYPLKTKASQGVATTIVLVSTCLRPAGQRLYVQCFNQHSS